MHDKRKIELAVRLPYMDIAKGVGILCVIVGHMGNKMLNQIIFSFHMPLFFVIGGYFLSEKQSAADIFVKRLKQLLKPYIITCIAVIFINTSKSILKCIFNKATWQLTIDEFLKWGSAALYGVGALPKSSIKITPIGAVWFLLAMIWGSFLTKYAQERRYPTLWVMGISLFGYVSSKFIWLPWSIQSAMTATVFMFIGTVLKKSNVLLVAKKTFLAVVMMIWVNEIIYGDPNLSIARNFYPNGMFDFIGGGWSNFNNIDSKVFI